MRHTFQSDAHVPVQNRVATKLLIPENQAQASPATNISVTPENWVFSSPTDFGSYINAKFLAMVL